jgi:hypothetical protein
MSPPLHLIEGKGDVEQISYASRYTRSRKSTLLLCHCEVHSRFWMCAGFEKTNNNDWPVKAPSATARFYSNRARGI